MMMVVFIISSDIPTTCRNEVSFRQVTNWPSMGTRILRSAWGRMM